MLASKDEYLNAAANSIFQYNTDEQIRKMCMDREEYYQDIRNYDRVLEEANKLLAEKDLLIKKSIAENQKLLTEIEQLKKRLRE